MTKSTIEKAVMRRVWRIYVTSLIVNKAAFAGFLAVVSGALFGRFVFVEAVIDNMLATELGQIPAFIYTAMTTADTPSLLAFAVLCVSVFMFAKILKRSLLVLPFRTYAV